MQLLGRLKLHDKKSIPAKNRSEFEKVMQEADLLRTSDLKKFDDLLARAVSLAVREEVQGSSTNSFGHVQYDIRET